MPNLKQLEINMNNPNCVLKLLDGLNFSGELILNYFKAKFLFQIPAANVPRLTASDFQRADKETANFHNHKDNKEVKESLDSLKKLMSSEFDYPRGPIVKPLYIFSKLKKLDLLCSCLMELDDDAFDNLISLKWLSLSYNDIKSITVNLFAKLINLEFLDLESNAITTIDSRAFDKLTNLKELNLSSALVIATPNGLFKNTKKLEIINL